MTSLVLCLVLISLMVSCSSIQQAKLSITSSSSPKGKQISSLSAEYPHQLSQVFLAPTKQYLSVSLTLDAITNADQIVLLLKDASSGVEAVFPFQKKSPGIFETSFRIGDRKFLSKIPSSGIFEISAIVAGGSTDPFQWDVGSMAIDIKHAPVPASHTLPEFQVESPGDKRVSPVVMPLLFSLITAAPFGLMLLLWSKIDFSWEWPQSGSVWVSSVAFIGGLVAMMGLLGAYWAFLDIFVTLQFMLVVSVVLLISGHKLLSSRVSQEDTKHPKSD